ncbi:PPC domain-containing protein, partial [Limnoraphis robusta]|uniref:PPC domain-containing protein n=1 Tax=Limnoraphis robusta TaxID=1118279 RepID=UPI002B20E80C
MSGNTLETAQDLGILTPGVDGGAFGEIGNSDPEDYFRFTLDTPSSLEVVLQGLTADADLEILDSNGNFITSSINYGSTSENLQLELEAGDYFARVYELGSPTPYDLVLIPTSTSNDNNNTLETAVDLGRLTPGVDGGAFGEIGNSDPEDYFRFTLDTPSSLEVVLQGLTADADLEI